MQLAAMINDDELFDDYYDSHYQLTADIALNDCASFDAWDENPPENIWTPIGYYHSFDGVFGGNGHVISGDYAGGIVGLASGLGVGDTSAKAVIRNCTNNGSITAAEDAGGIVGHVLHTFAYIPR